MSKHIGRNQRWKQASSTEYVSDLGRVVYQRCAWYAVFEYRLPLTEPTAAPAASPRVWVSHSSTLGPFKRPRNAMVALEREAVMLRNRHGDDILFGNELWADVSAR